MVDSIELIKKIVKLKDEKDLYKEELNNVGIINSYQEKTFISKQKYSKNSFLRCILSGIVCLLSIGGSLYFTNDDPIMLLSLLVLIVMSACYSIYNFGVNDSKEELDNKIHSLKEQLINKEIDMNKLDKYKDDSAKNFNSKDAFINELDSKITSEILKDAILRSEELTENEFHYLEFKFIDFKRANRNERAKIMRMQILDDVELYSLININNN